MSNVQINSPSGDVEQWMSPALEEVERRLRDAVVGSRGLVDELTAHLATAGGKRLRPMLVLLCAQFGREELRLSEAVLNSCLVVELTHLATLYHDDVMDSAPVRRGAPAAQHVWGNNRAILAGDVLFARASRRCADLGTDSVRQNAITFERLCIGQLNETFGPRSGEDPVDFYLQVLADKTGSLVAQSARYGAQHSGASLEVANIVAAYGEKVGVAFQIADDVLDLSPNAQTSGKRPGTDLREGIDTLPVLLLRRDAKEGVLDQAGYDLLAALETDLSSDEALATVVAKLRQHDVVEQTRQLALKWAHDAVTELDALPDGGAKKSLGIFANMLADRIA